MYMSIYLAWSYSMDDSFYYKENFLIPVLRRKLNEVSALAVDMEATIIYQNAKIKELSEKLLEATNNSTRGIEDGVGAASAKIRKKQTAPADGGSF